MKPTITVSTVIDAPIEKVWQYWNEPAHIQEWCHASDDWHAPHATNDLREGGRFTTRMEAKDGSFGFDFGGTYTAVVPNERIAYTMDDGRTVNITFTKTDGGYRIDETFEAESENPIEMQRGGWQAILDSFKKHVTDS